MGYYEALRGRGKRIESGTLSKKAAKKGLWGSVGRTLGGLAAAALTGGAATPWVVAAMTGGGTFLGSAAGAKLSGTGDLAEGSVWFEEEAKGLQKELGAFGSQNIKGALTSAVTAGVGQKLKLGKEAAAAKSADPSISKEAIKAIQKGKGMDFAESAAGKGASRIGQAYRGGKLQKMGEGAIGTTESIVGGVGRTKGDIMAESVFGREGDITNIVGDIADTPVGRVRTPIATGDIAGRVDLGMQQKQLGLMSQGRAPGLFRQTREGGAPVLQGESLDAILQRQSASAPVGQTFGLPSTIRGYDYQAESAGKARDTSEMLRWQDRLF